MARQGMRGALLDLFRLHPGRRRPAVPDPVRDPGLQSRQYDAFMAHAHLPPLGDWAVGRRADAAPAP